MIYKDLVRMNIYHLVSQKVWCGCTQYTYDLSCRQREDGHYVEIVCRRKPEIITPFHHAEFPISTLPLKGITDIDSAMRLARVIKRRKDVIIHAHSFKDAFTACLARKLSENKNVRVVVTRHLLKKAKSGVIYNTLYNDIDKIVFVSQKAKDSFLLSKPKIDSSKLSVIYNSVRNYMEQPVDLHAMYNVPKGATILMYLGRLLPEKGVEVLIKALCQLDAKKYFLVLAGNGEKHFMEKLHSLVSSNRIDNNVAFAGFVDNPQNYIAGCDVGITPSVHAESFGITNLEYMSQGKPIITSDNGGQGEYITHEKEGILTEPGNPYLLAASINDMLTNPTKRKNMGKAAAKKFEEELSYEIFYQQMSQIYKELK